MVAVLIGFGRPTSLCYTAIYDPLQHEASRRRKARIDANPQKYQISTQSRKAQLSY